MDRIILNKKDTTVSVLLPGGIYTGSRFDWTGIIDQITVGTVNFLGLEAGGDYRGTEGIGLSSEFGIKTPLSYRWTLPGKSFMKIGVGALKKESIKPYNFSYGYKVQPFETAIRSSDSFVDFSQLGCSVGNYCCDYIKRIEVAEREVTLHYHLINRGNALIRTEEYCHNFFRPGDRNLTEAITLETNYPLKSRKTVGEIKIESKQISFARNPEDVFYMYSLLGNRPQDFSWKIKNRETGLSITGYENFPASKFALWGMSHVISPETFHSFSLKPGSDLKWSRRYRFEV